MAAVVLLPLVVDLVSRLAGAHPTLADARSQVALAVTGILMALTAVRVPAVSGRRVERVSRRFASARGRRNTSISPPASRTS